MLEERLPTIPNHSRAHAEQKVEGFEHFNH